MLTASILYVCSLFCQLLEKATAEEKETKDFDHPIYKAKREVEELQGILPDIKAKIEDVEDEKKNMEALKNLAKEAVVSKWIKSL